MSSSPARAATRRLHLLGDGGVADKLGELASSLGYDEIRRGDALPEALGEEDHVVVEVRDPRRARQLLAAVLAIGDPGYLGFVATENEATVALLKLTADGVPRARVERIHAPAGVPLGAVTDDERAIAIAAELIGLRRRPHTSS